MGRRHRRRKKRGCIHAIAVFGGFVCLVAAVLSISYGIGLNTGVVKEIEKELTKPKEIDRKSTRLNSSHMA